MKLTNKLLTIISVMVLTMPLMAMSCDKEGGNTNNGEDNDKFNPGDPIEIVDGNVKFYISFDKTSPRIKMSGDEIVLKAGGKIRVNNKMYTILEDEDARPYVEVVADKNGEYIASAYSKSKYFKSSCFTDVFLPYSQIYDISGYALDEFPVYSRYTEEEGNILNFGDAFSLLEIELTGKAELVSVKVEDPSKKTYFGGYFNYSNKTGALVKSKARGVDFATLNCTNNGNGVILGSSAKKLYVIIPSINYASGLNLVISDMDHLSMDVAVPAFEAQANKSYKVDVKYSPEANLVFSESFDNFVWGGNIAGGPGSVGFSPSSEETDKNSGLSYMGDEESMSSVNYDNAAAGYVQPNEYDGTKDVAENHRLSEQYLKSRNLYDWTALFRSQEYQGCLAIGAEELLRGIAASPRMGNLEQGKHHDIKVSFNCALQYDYNDDLLLEVINSGIIKSCKVNGKDVQINSGNSSYIAISSSLMVSKANLNTQSSASSSLKFNEIELVVENATNATTLRWTSSMADYGDVHGLFIDDIKVYRLETYEAGENLRVLVWNIQNGMWSDQGNNFNNFVDWVKTYDPDVCIWCEASTIYKDGTSTSTSDRVLPDGWSALASRYGHKYVMKSAHRDNYPQVITSKFPIKKIKDIVGGDGSVIVSHGASHTTIEVDGQEINIVSLHLWPQAYPMGSSDRNPSSSYGGDNYRLQEITEICNQTVNNPDNSSRQNWILTGDFNSRSVLDNWYYKFPTDDSKLFVTNYIENNTNLEDIIVKNYPGYMFASTGGNTRIDLLYTSPSMAQKVVKVVSVVDDYTVIKKDKSTSFHHPSDHRPVLVDFDMK